MSVCNPFRRSRTCALVSGGVHRLASHTEVTYLPYLSPVLKFEFKCKESPLCLVMIIPFFISVVYGTHWWSESSGFNVWKKREQLVEGYVWLMGRERHCGFHGTLCCSLLRAAWLAPAPLLGTDYTQLPNQLSLCAEGLGLLTAWDHAGFQWIHMGCCPSKWLIPCVCEWDTWVEAFLRQCCTTVGSQGCEAKCSALRLVLCAVFTPPDLSVSVSRTSAGVSLLGISCGNCSHKPGNWRW